MDSGKAAGESDPRLIHTEYGQHSAGHRMSARLRVFVWTHCHRHRDHANKN